MAPERLIGARYLLQDRLGSGAAGTVWRATDQVLGRTVAVKEIHQHLGDDDTAAALARERAIREARSTAALRHPHIVPIHDVIDGDEFPWIVMQLIDGVSLRRLVGSCGPMAVNRVVGIGLDLLDALEAAHRAGIVHRDVKPANVLLGSDGRVWLTDFGIAHITGDATVTESGIALGTPGYLAPEQARGVRAGPEADIFGLAATLYFAVEGVGPFEAETAVGALGAVVFSPPRPPVRAARLGPVLTSMLDKDPAARPSVARARSELAGALWTPPGAGGDLVPRARPAGAIARAWSAEVVSGARSARAIRRAGPAGAIARRLGALARRSGQVPPTVAVAAVLALGVAAVSLQSGQSTGRSPAGTADNRRPPGVDPPDGGKRDGGSPGRPPPGRPPGLHRVASVELPGPFSGGQVAVARDDSLYLADGRRLLAINLATGGRRWSADSPATGSLIRLTVTRDAVAVHGAGPDATTSGAALFRAGDGHPVWWRDGAVVGLTQLPGGLVFVQYEEAGRRRHSVVAADGTVLWRSDGPGPAHHVRTAAGDDLLLEWSSADTVRVRRVATGEVLSSGPAGALATVPPTQIVDGIAVGTTAGEVIGVDVVQRRLRWRVPGQGALVRCTVRLLCLHDAGAGRMTAIDARTGSPRWTAENVAFRAEGYAGLDGLAADMPAIEDRAILVRGTAVTVLDAANGALVYQGDGRPVLLDERHLLVLRTEPDRRTAVSFIHLLDGHVRPLDTLAVPASACAASMRYLACPTVDSTLAVWALPPPPPPPPG